MRTAAGAGAHGVAVLFGAGSSVLSVRGFRVRLGTAFPAPDCARAVAAQHPPPEEGNYCFTTESTEGAEGTMKI